MKHSSGQKVIIIIGPPGSGKGSQANLLAEKLGLHYLETSKFLEETFQEAKKGEFVEVGGKKYFLEDERKLWSTGFLMSPPFVAFLLKERIKVLYKEGKGIVLAGSPRTLDEAEKEIPLLEKMYGVKNIRVVLLEITPKETLFRNSHRRICELMRHPILYSQENAKLTKCPLDGSKLVKRKGLDNPETIKVRLREYKERTLPLIDYFQKRGLKVVKIKGSPPPAIVFKNILKTLKPRKPPNKHYI